MDEYAKEWVMEATREQQRIYRHFIKMLEGQDVIKKALCHRMPNEIIAIVTDYVIDLCDVDAIQNEDYWDRDDDEMEIDNVEICNRNVSNMAVSSHLHQGYGASRYHHDVANVRFAPY